MHHLLIQAGQGNRNEFKMAPNVLNWHLQYNHNKPLFTSTFLWYTLAKCCIIFMVFRASSFLGCFFFLHLWYQICRVWIWALTISTLCHCKWWRVCQRTFINLRISLFFSFNILFLNKQCIYICKTSMLVRVWDLKYP